MALDLAAAFANVSKRNLAILGGVVAALLWEHVLLPPRER